MSAVAAGAPGCVVTDADVGSSFHDVETENALTSNALTSNALTSNALTSNALTSNALTPNVFELDYSNTDLHLTAEGRELLKYIVRCALPDGEYIHLDAQSSPEVLPEETFAGLMGVASEWKYGGIEAEKAIMSACLLAHLNYDGSPVGISARFDGADATTQAETDQFYVGDAVFYGDVFDPYADPRKWYSCKIPKQPGTPVASSSSESLRICDDDLCGVTATGDCTEVCSDIVSDGFQWRFSSCVGGGQVHSATFSVWLRGEDGPPCDSSYVGYSCKPTL